MIYLYCVPCTNLTVCTLDGQNVISAAQKKMPRNMFWKCASALSERQFRVSFNEIAKAYPQVANYLGAIPLNLWVTHYINEQLLKNNPDGGGGTYGKIIRLSTWKLYIKYVHNTHGVQNSGWRSNNMSEGSMSRNKAWRYMHVLYFFHEFVKKTAGWIQYIKSKQIEWQHETFTPDALTRLRDAESRAMRRTATQTGSSKIFSVKAQDGKCILTLLS